MEQNHCRFFKGTRPCGLSESCHSGCPQLDPIRTRILIVHLGALGAVIRSTSLLKAIKRKYPQSWITWITDKPAHKLLSGHPLIDQVMNPDPDELLELSAQKFTVAFVIDKSLKAAGILRWTSVDQVFGFVSDPSLGAIVPATQAARELYELGLSNKKKFFENTKPETRLVAEALELGYERDPYDLPLALKEEQLLKIRKLQFRQNKKLVVGLNTGCSDTLPAKKVTVDYHRELIVEIQKKMQVSIVLLGGPEDEIRNQRIAFGLDVIQSPTHLGLRDGLVSVAACDLIFTGDSLGMHMAISQKKWTVAWFGPTCGHEIDFFGRGEAVQTKAGCSPCWKKTCSESIMCYDLVSIDEVLLSLQRGASLIHATDRDCSNSISRGPALEYTPDPQDSVSLA